jgi:integrase
MIPRNALAQAKSRLDLAACPYRLRVRSKSPYLYVYETRKGGRNKAAHSFRADDPVAVNKLTELLLAAQGNLQLGGSGLDWEILDALRPGRAQTQDQAETWGQICTLIVADLAPGGPKAKDHNPFSCFKKQGYFGKVFSAATPATTDQLEQFCLYTPASLVARQLDPRQALVKRAYNSSGFAGVVQMVKYLARKQIAIATPELIQKLEALKKDAGPRKKPEPRFIPSTENLETWLDLVCKVDPLRGWVMAMIATFGLRPHEVWHINRLPGQCTDSSFLEVSTYDGTGNTTTKTGHRFAVALPDKWLKRYRLDDPAHSKKMLAALRQKHQIKTARARDGSIQCFNNSDLGCYVGHWLNHSGHRSSELTHKLMGEHQPIAIAGQMNPAPIQGRSTPYDLRHAWAIRARETTTWSTTLKAQAMGHSEAIHTSTYLAGLTAFQKEQGMALLKAHDEGQPHLEGKAPLVARNSPAAPAASGVVPRCRVAKTASKPLQAS